MFLFNQGKYKLNYYNTGERNDQNFVTNLIIGKFINW